ncbi:MAG: hypothetical protein IKI63_06975 [Clostridia bacterium]|nr:hypothetical protein [Clostridia bacterium]
MNEEILEEVSAKPEETHEPATAAIWEAEYRLTEEEWRACYQRTRAKTPSRLKTGVRVAVLGTLFVGFAAYYLFVEPNGMSLFLAILCALLALMVAVVPPLEQRRAIRAAAASPRQTRIREVADGLEFGAGDGYLKQPFSALTLTAYPDMVIVGLPGDQRLAIPRRAVDETAWEWLCARASAPTDRRTSARRGESI